MPAHQELQAAQLRQLSCHMADLRLRLQHVQRAHPLTH